MDEHNQEVTKVDVAATQPRNTAAVDNHQSHMDRRTQRLEDLTIEALQEPNALRATVKAATAQLLDIGFRLGDEIKGTISTQPAKAKSRQNGVGAINTLMLVHRQVTRYVQLDQQWASVKALDKETGMHSAKPDEVA
ncbi:MAG: hypothetical protein ACLQLG_17660 [Thermoguttaceae bacterium]|jgi:hypothetical protein